MGRLSRRPPEPARPPEGRRRPPEPARPPREPRDGPRPRHKGDGKGKPPKGKGKKGKGKTGKGGTRRNRPGQAQRRRRQEAREAAATKELRAKARPAPGPPPDAAPESGPPERDLTDPPRPREHRNDADDDDDEPNDEEDGDGEEHAESETLTYDPTVELTPSELMDDRLPGKSQPAASSSPQRPTKKEPVVHRSPLASRRPGSSRPSVDPPSIPGRSQATGEAAWDPRKGPAPGIRWKSGAPPAPPRYTADAKEVGSFDRFVRRVRLWAKRAASWMTDGDAALLLVESLSGAAERELEFTPLEDIERGGVEFILQTLEKSSNEHIVYRKHHYLRSWETVRRQGGETMRAYIHRFDLLHRQLAHVDVDVKAMYSGEALGHRHAPVFRPSSPGWCS